MERVLKGAHLYSGHTCPSLTGTPYAGLPAEPRAAPVSNQQSRSRSCLVCRAAAVDTALAGPEGLDPSMTERQGPESQPHALERLLLHQSVHRFVLRMIDWRKCEE